MNSRLRSNYSESTTVLMSKVCCERWVANILIKKAFIITITGEIIEFPVKYVVEFKNYLSRLLTMEDF